VLVWMQLNVMNWSEDLQLDSTYSRAISRKILTGSRSTAASVASSLAGVLTVRGRSAFRSVLGFTHFLSLGDTASVV
jgi:hypothetical protein